MVLTISCLVRHNCLGGEKLKRKMAISGILFTAIFLLSLATPTLAITPSDTAYTHRPPPGMVLSPDLVGDNSSQNPEPDLGNPVYWDSAFYGLGGGTGGYTGVYGHIYPQPINFETDWWAITEEYWVQMTVVNTGHAFAEIGLDVTRHNIYGVWVWHTEVYAGYSEDPYGYGTLFAYYDLGWSTEAPAYAALGVYEKDGAIWGWNANGIEFATHSYSQSWQGYSVHSVTEAYNQPVEGTSGQYISITDSLYIKRADNGQWNGALYDSGNPNNGVHNGWMVDMYATNGYHYDLSIRQ